MERQSCADNVSVYLLSREKSIRTSISSLAMPVLELAFVWSTLAYRIHGLDDMIRIVLLFWIVASIRLDLPTPHLSSRLPTGTISRTAEYLL